MQHPALVALSGPLTGRIFALDGAEMTLGRHASSTVHLREVEVSRHHCVIERSGAGFLLRDLESRHGTFVNGVPVRERLLSPGDRIGVGSSLFLFLESDEAPAEDPAEPRVTPFLTLGESTVHAAGPGLPPALLAPLPAEAKSVEALSVLLGIGADLAALQTAAPFAQTLLARAFEVIPAERAALLLSPTGGGEPETATAFARGEGPIPPFAVSRTVVTRVVEERVALLANGVLESAGLGEAESVRAARVRSLLAAPLVASDGVLGVLYLDTRAPAVRFDDTDLRLLRALAGIAGLALANARRTEWLAAERQRLEAALGYDMVGESPRMREVQKLLARLAPTPSTVLLRGESGTGKEVAARALHRSSPRAERPFVAVNCATFSDTLLESELFGHERGAFTGAVERKVGRLEAAHGGTLFLDEVGEIPLHLQARLLRVLQEREFERLGGTRTIRVDVRVVAATNRDLEAALAAGTFREDLFYRLNVITVTLPPLRERQGDVALLASCFAARAGAALGRRVAGFTPEARTCLERYAWPGNVRELANAVERAVVLGDGELIRPEDLPESVLEAGLARGEPRAPEAAGYHDAVQALKRRLILDAMGRAQGSVTRAAELLGLNPTYLHRLINNLELRALV